MAESYASHNCAADSTSVSSTVCRSNVERLMMAGCCARDSATACRASASSRVRASSFCSRSHAYVENFSQMPPGASDVLRPARSRRPDAARQASGPDHETGQPVFDDFGSRTSIERDHGTSAADGLDQDQSERLGPRDRRQQRDRAPEKARFFPVADLAEILERQGAPEACGFRIRNSRGRPHRPWRRSSAARHISWLSRSPIDSLFRRNAAEKAK
jgi:hypothetical protein